MFTLEGGRNQAKPRAGASPMRQSALQLSPLDGLSRWPEMCFAWKSRKVERSYTSEP